MTDYYKILEVSPKASQEVIKAAYEVLLQHAASDKNPNHSETAQITASIKLAYAVLSDPEKRKAYDIQLDKVRTAANESSSRHSMDVSESTNTSTTSRFKLNRVEDATDMPNDTSLLSRLKWKKWGWIVSIVAVVVILISMVQPDPEKAERGQLAVKLEAERDKQKLEAEMRKKTAEANKNDSLEKENKSPEAAKVKSAQTNAVVPAP
jgi:curved DNA-binding protein CbpA